MDNSSLPPPVRPRARDRYAHLYMPLITTFVILANRPIFRLLFNPSGRPFDAFLGILGASVLTFSIGTCVHKPDTVPWDGVRFTRRHEAIRALVILSYGRWHGTPINLQFIIADWVLSNVVSQYLIGEPAKQRRSEFLVALLYLVGSGIAFGATPGSWEIVYFFTGMVDRIVWRTAYLALVDDIVGVLWRPDVRTVRGRATLLLVQAFTISSLVYGVLSWMRRTVDARAGKV